MRVAIYERLSNEDQDKKDINSESIINQRHLLLEEISKYDTNNVYVIGGGSIYELLEPHCDTALITRIEYEYDADTHFPKLDKLGWELTEESEEQTYFDIIYYFDTYKRLNDR